MQDSGDAHFNDCFNEPNIDARLKAFWDAYTWEVVPNSQAANAALKIR